MTDPVKEQLSACLDGELPEGELDLLLKRLERDPQLRRCIGDYALVGEALRSQRPVGASAGFAARVSAAIAAEPAVQTPAIRPSSTPRISPAAAMTWLRPAAGLAIAAGVAAVAVLSFRPTAMQPQLLATQTNQTAKQTANQAANETAAAPADSTQAPSYTVPTNPGSTAFVPAARLTNYVVAHSEYSSPLGRRTVLSGVLSDDEPDEGDVAVSVSSPDVAPSVDSGSPATSDMSEPQR